ncbi:hypothetical protein L9F63_012180 [Diploptera punctata]|uniref:C2H2-type domain-containing protein n=1 Tax=Diploptera punctata TaxID=6984 RepID=A0AAD8ACZ5_DIPPU|nr:hypothetical protein L9F63_012180 [Diploptera punctata]
MLTSTAQNSSHDAFVLQDNVYNKSIQQPHINESQPYVCVNCGRTYTWKGNLQRHIKLECGKVPNVLCQYCPYRTKRTDELKKHMRRIHNIFSSSPQP